MNCLNKLNHSFSSLIGSVTPLWEHQVPLHTIVVRLRWFNETGDVPQQSGTVAKRLWQLYHKGEELQRTQFYRGKRQNLHPKPNLRHIRKQVREVRKHTVYCLSLHVNTRHHVSGAWSYNYSMNSRHLNAYQYSEPSRGPCDIWCLIHKKGCSCIALVNIRHHVSHNFVMDLASKQG